MTDATAPLSRVGDYGLRHPETAMPAGEAAESLTAVHTILSGYLPPGEIAIYEAGGGAASYLPQAMLRRARVTVVDLDPTQIANNTYAQTLIQGDVQAHRFPPGCFDLVTCYNVIEHLPDVEAAMVRFCEALKPGGLLLIGAPHPRSLSGLVTRYAPHWFHVWFYRQIRGNARAGQPGEPPFPVHFHPLVLPRRLIAFAEARGFEMLYRRDYESPRYPEMRARRPWIAAILDRGTDGINAALAHHVNVRHGDYHLVLRKRDRSYSAGL